MKTILLASTILVAATTPALATDADSAQVQPTVAPVDAEVGNELEDIVVTARRRAERLQDVAASIQAFGSEQIEKARIGDVRDLASNVSGMTIQESDSPTVFINIRGNTTQRFGDTPMSLIIDGVQFYETRQLSQGLLDVERIEVLKGPQGAIYGRNAIAGAINIVTRKPSDQFEGRVTAEIGNHNYYQLNSSLSGPIVPDVLAFRASGIVERNNPWLYNVTTGDHPYNDTQKAGRGTLAFTPSDRLEINLAGGYSDRRNPQFRQSFVPIVLPPGAILENSDLPDPNFLVDPGSTPGLSTTLMYDVSLRANYDFGVAMLSTVAAITDLDIVNDRVDLDLTPTRGLFTNNRSTARTRAQEVRLTSQTGDALRWQLGGDYLKVRRTLLSNVFWDVEAPLLGFPRLPANQYPRLISANDTVDRNNAWAIFGQAGVRLGQLDLSIEARFDRERRTTTDLLPASPTFNTVFARVFKAFQPKGTVSYFFTRDIMAYATVGKGYRIGGFNARDRFGRSYDPETVVNYESGVKTSFADGRLIVNGAVFHQAARNRQLYLFDLTTSSFGITNSTRRAWVRGAEIDIVGRPARGVRLQLSGSLTDSKITEAQAVPGVAVTDNLTGNKLTQTPLWTYSASGEYAFPLGDLTVSGRAELQGNGGNFYWFIDNVQERDDVHLVNLSLSVETGPVRLSAFVSNLFDHRYITSYGDSRWGGTPTRGAFNQQAPHRQIGVGATFRF